MTEELKVDDGQVVSMHYTLHVDGQAVDSSQARGIVMLHLIGY